MCRIIVKMNFFREINMDYFKYIIDSINIGVVFADNKHIIRYMDDFAAEHYAKDGGRELIGKSLFDCHRSTSVEKIKQLHGQMLMGELDETMVRKIDKMDAYMKVVKDDLGGVVGYLEYFKKIEKSEMPVMENLYQRSYVLYDEIQFHKNNNKDINFYKNIIPPKDSVLEIGCGTGRISLELAKRGNKVLGLDLSQEMLNVLNEKIVHQMSDIKGSIDTIHQDMTKLDLKSKFDWIIFPNRVFQFFLTDKLRTMCLENIKKLLKPERHVIIDLFNPAEINFENWEKKNSLEMSFFSEQFNADIKLDIIGERHFEKQQIISFKNVYKIIKDNKQPEVIEEPMRMAYLYKEQIETMINERGFSVEEAFGDWNYLTLESNHVKELIYILKG